jgi:hypothetical protein
MFSFTLKSTGETIVLPTPSGNENTKIDTLPCGQPLTEAQIKEYFRFKEKHKLINKHWNFVKNKEKDGKKYSERYSREEHFKFFNRLLEVNFEDTKEMINHVVKTNTPWNPA